MQYARNCVLMAPCDHFNAVSNYFINKMYFNLIIEIRYKTLLKHFKAGNKLQFGQTVNFIQ